VPFFNDFSILTEQHLKQPLEPPIFSNHELFSQTIKKRGLIAEHRIGSSETDRSKSLLPLQQDSDVYDIRNWFRLDYRRNILGMQGWKALTVHAKAKQLHNNAG